MAIHDDAFSTMLARARGYRGQLDELGISRSAIEANVCARLQSKTPPELAQARPGLLTRF